VSKVLTLAEAAKFLRVHPSTIYRLLKQRDLSDFRVGSDHHFTQEAMEVWMKDRENLQQP
jgi:excisionase family DNA binding protein